MSAPSSYTLSNGVQMPAVGLGTYRVRDQETLDACILQALQSGYRLIDTATVYRNETMIGNSLKKILDQNLIPGLERKDIFITSKLEMADYRHDQRELNLPPPLFTLCVAVMNSLSNLQVDYIDLYLIHWPGTAKLKLSDPQNAMNRMQSWHALQDLYHAHKLRAIGVSNYTLAHLSQLVQQPLQHHNDNETTVEQQQQQQQQPLHAQSARTTVIPHVHQFEMHPRLYQRDVIDFCKTHRIQIQAYSSLGEGRLISQAKWVDQLPAALDIMPDLIQKYFGKSCTDANMDTSMETSMETSMDTNMNTAMDTAMDTTITTDLDTTATTSMEVSTHPIVQSTTDMSPQEYAEKAAKILLRWGLQHGAVVIPKSSQPTRVRNNIDLFSFEIDASDMLALDAYSLEGERTRYCWNPTEIY
ncbi:hypothetical protein BGZ94_007516 [Podila epigama]|nr:hypothetical protein BGZ94_007516 [Podila epigama]